MFVYVFLFLFLCGFIYFENIKINKVRSIDSNCKEILALLSIIALWIMSSLRWYTGHDFAEYIAIYNYTPSVLSGDNIFRGYGNIEPGFRVIAAVAKAFDSHVVYLALCAALSLFPLYLGLKKFRYYIPIGFSYAILIYFCFFYVNYNFNAMRQAITMGFFIYSITYMYEKKTFKVVLISLLIALVHSTGLLILLSYIASRFFIVDSYKKVTVIFILSLVAYKVDFLTKIFVMAGVNISRWQELWGEISASSIILRLILILMLIFPKPVFKQGPVASLLFTFYMFGFFIYMALGSVDMMAARFNMFFRVLEVLLIPMLIASYKFKINKVIQCAILLVLYILILLATVSADANSYYFYF